MADGKEILLRETDAAIAKACAALLHDNALCKGLGEAARAATARQYDVDVVKRSVAGLIQDMLRH
jgi:glycosyltransferase involved in cell wall biosynthesis